MNCAENIQIQRSARIKMQTILYVLLIVNICNSNKPTIISRFDSSNEVISQNDIEYSGFFPTIDPDIIEDVNLTTVRYIEQIKDEL